ncbi:MAG TPA: helix-turn-helix domain-containing protein [Nocardioidaceae bacterium]|nr:helix-turn-helix domain-containing protein [Nocardioidaceae bacterium]
MPETTIRLPSAVLDQLRLQLPGVSEQVLAAVVAAVPDYADPFRGRMGRNIETAIRVALEGFIDLSSSPKGMAAGSQVQFVYDAAYELGRGEARSGRSMDALASAYRVGARTAWRDMSNAAVKAGMPAGDLAQFAELVFAYIDELSDASVRGHVDELASTGRLRQRRLERLFGKLLDGEPEDALVSAAERADWEPPKTLTAVILTEVESRQALTLLDERTLLPGEDINGLDPQLTVLLVPDAGGRSRAALKRVLRDTTAVVGPVRPWTAARASYERALQALGLELAPAGMVDTDAHLVELVLGSDPEAMADLRARVLAPLQKVSPTSREKLTDTLRAWLMYHGRREDIAAALFVHPQTVRYRMGQLRELYGDKLTDPRTVLELTVALAGR